MVALKEIRTLQKFAQMCAEITTEEEQQQAMLEFFFPRRLHLLIPSGFDEIRFDLVPITPSEEEKKTSASTRRIVKLGRVAAVRRIESGAWFYVGYGSEPSFVRDPDDTEPKIALIPVQMPKRLSDMVFLPLTDVAEAAMRTAEHPSALVLPPLWRPPEKHASIELVDTTKSILLALQREAVTLRSLGWRQFEEVVAELLRAQGLDVTLTKPTRDGGRDIIARGELIPGEPTILAVEVKNRGVVGTPDIHRAWAANRDFPLVMIATAGRFSAGVIREKRRSDVYHRLWLKDGSGLSQWIAQYRPR